MHDMRSIVDDIATIRSRRTELAAMRPDDPVLASELSVLEAKASLFAEMCVRHHRINLCQAGFVYGSLLRHPADGEVALAVRLGDRVEIVQGPDAREGEITIAEATAILGRRIGRGLAFRDWHAAGRSLGEREDDLFMKGPRGADLRRALDRYAPAGVENVTDGQPAATPPTPAEASTEAAPAERVDRETPRAADMAPPTAKPRRTRTDQLTPDLFG